MKNKSLFFMSRVFVMTSVVALAACAGSTSDDIVIESTPTVDYIKSLDVYSAPHKDSFLNQLAMNYRSYAIYNADTSGYFDVGEYFAQKAVAAFSGETPFPESLDNWAVEDEQVSFELYTGYSNLMDQLKNDASMAQPQLAAEAQAKFDCWLSATATGQTGTAEECRERFYTTMQALSGNNGKIINGATASLQKDGGQASNSTTQSTISTNGEMVVAVERGGLSSKPKLKSQAYYPETRNMSAMRGTKAREGVIIVNNVNVPEHLIEPEPVQPLVFNQNIYGGDKTISDSNNINDNSVRECVREGDVNCIQTKVDAKGATNPDDAAQASDENVNQNAAQPTTVLQPVIVPQVRDDLVTREEFVDMMMAMRAELAAINERLDKLQDKVSTTTNNTHQTYEKTLIKVQQIPLEPKQRVMEEVFEVLFDFDKATIKPEYEQLIKQLATATQESKNIKVSVIGHTDTMGSADYNYALGGRRAEAVQKMLIKYGIPAGQIVAVSAGEEDLAVQTGDGVANPANRRVQVIKEVHYTERPQKVQKPMAVVEEYMVPVQSGVCGMYGCAK